MNLRHLRVFIQVCQEGSMTAAAKKLYISQPSVGQAIQHLEESLHAKLFERIPGKLRITPFGNFMLDYAYRIISLYDEMILSAGSYKETNHMKIGCGIAFGKLFMPVIVREYMKLHPDCQLDVIVNSAEIIEPMLLENQLDFCITEGTIHANNLQHQTLQVSPLVAFCNVNHPLAEKKNITIQELAKENLLLREKFSSVRTAIDTWFSSNNLPVKPVWESISALALINAVSENLGISILPLNYVLALSNPNIVILDVDGLNINESINVLYPIGKKLTPPMNEFINFSKQFC